MAGRADEESGDSLLTWIRQAMLGGPDTRIHAPVGRLRGQKRVRSAKDLNAAWCRPGSVSTADE